MYMVLQANRIGSYLLFSIEGVTLRAKHKVLFKVEVNSGLIISDP
jgi:hypothetical protein